MLLRGREPVPAIQQPALVRGQRDTVLAVCKNCDSVSPNASQIFSREEKEGVMPFLYHEEMVDCGRPERSAS